jgi:hypothetical protein
MTSQHYQRNILTLNNKEFNVGDLVTTILGDYGIIISIGEHNTHRANNTEYYHVLIDTYVQCYLPFALIKVKNEKILDKEDQISYTINRSLQR